MMTRLLTAVFTLTALALAQDKGAPSPAPLMAPRPDVIRVIQIKQADVQELANTLGRVLGGIATLSADNTRRALIVRGSAESVAVVEEAVKTLDVAPPPPPTLRVAAPVNIELSVHLLYGSATDGRGDPVPADLASTVKQLTSLFQYKTYRVLESFVIRGRDGQDSDSSGSLPNGLSMYNFRTRLSVMPGPAPRLIRLDNLQLGLKLFNDTTRNYVDTGIRTSLDAHEGQKVVVGKSNVSGTADAIILVVSPKVVE